MKHETFSNQLLKIIAGYVGSAATFVDNFINFDNFNSLSSMKKHTNDFVVRNNNHTFVTEKKF